MKNPKRYLVTAALPYANGPVHIGHLAGCYLPADIYVRYLRAQNRDVKFIGGSDEHGVPITIRAMKEGITPQDVVDRYHAIIKESMAKMGISFDIYSRTSNKIHHETASAFFKKLYDDGLFEEKETEQYYDETTNTFLADRYITGTCPNCANPNAYGDQCEKCGTDLSPEQLINPKSTLSNAVPIKKKTTHWYFPLQNYEPWLKEWLLEGHTEWKNNVYGQCKSWIDKGLQPRAMTRDSNWGIKVPKLNPASPNPSKGGEHLSEDQNSSFDYLTADPYSYGILRQFADEHKAKPTGAENILWQALRGKKLDSYKFRRQQIIGNFIADFVCLPYKLIIEVDGLIHQIPENKISDVQRTEELNKFGFEVIRFTNEEVIGNIEDVLEKILQKIAAQKSNLESTKNPPLEGREAAKNPPLEGREAAKNPPLEGREAGKVLYVWFDAPIGYISATKELTENWQDYWCKEDTKLVHFIGKDNIVFHCIIFPAMLKAHGGFVLPENVPANEFLNIEGEKVSTSRNWAVWVHEYIKDFEGCEDVLRYVLCANAPETKDNDFTWKDFQDRNNSELVSIFGNFVNRTWVLMHKLCKGKVPILHQDILDDKDKALVDEIKNAKVRIEKNIEDFKLRDALFEVIDLSRKGNKYLQEKEPWIVAKKASLYPSEAGAAQKVIDNCLHICLQLTANLAILANPFLPNTTKKLLAMMKVVDKMLDWENAGRIDLLKVGYTLRAPELLFRKIEDEEIATQMEKLKNGASLNPSEGGTSEPLNKIEETQKNTDLQVPHPEGFREAKPTIQFDDFAKIDLKVGTIIAAEKVEKADKLLKLEVDLGFEKRTIVSGIALHFEPSAIVGKQVVVVTNLAPRKMRGIESNGMILMAENKDGSLKFVAPSEAADNGIGVS